MSHATTAFEQRLTKLVRETLANQAARHECVYVVGLITSFPMDDPREGRVDVFVNTEADVERAAAGAQGPEEARWNLAFWSDEVGAVGGDEGTAGIREAWIRSLELWWTEEDEDDDPDACDEKAEELRLAWYDLLAGVARRMHEGGALEEYFGGDLPVIVGDIHLDDESFEATEAANPQGQASAFLEGW